MKLLILKDKHARTSDLEAVLKKLKARTNLDLKWEYQDEDFLNVPWEEYSPGKKGISRVWLKNTAQVIFGARGYGIDIIVCFPTVKNWKGIGTLGWGMDGFYGNYGLLQIKKTSADTLEHEIDHLADTFKSNIAPAGINWDYGVVHGEHPVYGIFREDLGKYYYKTKKGDYSHTLGKIRVFHHYQYSDAIEQRKRNSEKIVLLQQIIALYQQIISAVKAQKVRDLSPASIQPPLADWGKLRITQKFNRPTHIGLDIAVPIGTPVYAPCNGKVEKFVGKEGGNTVWFTPDHTPEFIRFLHLDKFAKLGQVNQGDIIGYTGNTGQSTGPHIHVDVSKGKLDLKDRSNFVDPEKYFKGR